jgi:hypothetical protein
MAAKSDSVLLMIFGKIRERKKELGKVWKQLWKPIGLVLAIVSAAQSVRTWQQRTGPFVYVSSALVVLAVAILFTIPINSVRLLARRLVAFVVDYVLLGLLTMAMASLLFKSYAIKPSAVVSMAIVWTWLAFFVLSDWRFGGTPGQFILGLRLRKGGGERAAFLTCLARNLLVLVVPVICAARILGLITTSRFGLFAQWSAGIAVISLIPLSIAFCGGQSIPDLFLGLVVLPKGASADPGRLTARPIFAVMGAALLTGIIFGFVSSVAYHSFTVEKKVPMPPVDFYLTSGLEEAKIAGFLRSHLNGGMLDPEAFSKDDYLSELRVFTASGRLPSENGASTAPSVCRASFDTDKSYIIISAQINPETLALVKAILFQNLINTSSQYVKRPDLLVLQITERQSYGVFSIQLTENYMLCVTASDAANGKPEVSVFDVSATTSLMASISEPAALLLGELDGYSQVENVPIWFR